MRKFLTILTTVLFFVNIIMIYAYNNMTIPTDAIEPSKQYIEVLASPVADVQETPSIVDENFPVAMPPEIPAEDNEHSITTDEETQPIEDSEQPIATDDETQPTVSGNNKPNPRIRPEIDPSKPMVAITFDDGPGKYTLPILDILERNGVLATFCVIGVMVEIRPEVVTMAYDMGHEIIGHTWTHRKLTMLSEAEIKDEILNTRDAIEALTGSSTNMFRAPTGLVDDQLKKVAAELEFSIISWSVDPFDWQTKNADLIYNHIMENVHDRAIILCHDLYDSTAEAMERIIPELIEQGYQLVTVSELMYYSDKVLEPGEIYKDGR